MDPYKCRLCGGNIEFEQGSAVGICDTCGNQVLLSFSDDAMSPEVNAASKAQGQESSAYRFPETKEKARKKNKKKAIIAIVAAVALVGIIAGVVWLMRQKKPIIDIASTNVGDTIRFGHYDDVNEWIVLKKNEDKLLLLSKYAICRRPYNNVYEDVTWSTCTLRNWLNTEYLTQAFSAEELELIADTYVINVDNSRWGTSGGDHTTDKVFLLSMSEVREYFTDDEARSATLTDGTSVWWWLRSPGSDSNNAANVDIDGSVYGIGNDVYIDYGAVRPALWIDISDL